MKKIGIIGYGYLGKAFEVAFKDKCYTFINDIKHKPDGKKFFDKSDLIELGMDLILIGVPTPYSKSKGFDPSIIDEVLFELDTRAINAKVRPLVCIKSAILPSYTLKIIEKYTNIDITVSPEYLSGKDNIRDMINHEVLIVGGDEEPRERVIELFVEHSICNKNVKTGVCSAADAALIKYMENCFLALKCVFMSEFYQLHKSYKDEYKVQFDEMLRLWMLDSRMGDYPYKIPYFGELGFDSHCLVKDTFAISDEFKNFGVNYLLGDANIKVNQELRKDLPDMYWRCNATEGGLVD